jgi:hypothetical protein
MVENQREHDLKIISLSIDFSQVGLLTFQKFENEILIYFNFY